MGHEVESTQTPPPVFLFVPGLHTALALDFLGLQWSDRGLQSVHAMRWAVVIEAGAGAGHQCPE